MRIAVDARELAGRSTGVGRYLRGLLDVWARDERAQRHEWVLFAHAPINAPFGSQRILQGSGGTSWEQVSLASALRTIRVEVLFSPAYTVPLLTSTPRIVTIHDLSYCAHPEWFRAREGVRRRWLTSRGARASRAILTDSAFSRGEIVTRLGVPADRVRVVYPGVTPRRGPQRSREAMVLYVGSLFNRRRLPDLIRGFARLARRQADLRLEIVGDDRTYPHQDLGAVIADERVGPHVRVREYVDEAVLGELYASARAFAFLSEYEGFGLTPLEALTAGVPSLVLDTPVAREVYEDAAYYVAAADAESVAAGLERVLFDEPLRTAILDRGTAILERYGWDAAAAQTLDAIEQVVA
jgi:glycosyltransferase involved in cell wall biosynthesis